MAIVVRIVSLTPSVVVPKEVINFEKDQITIGRTEANDLQLADSQVSGRHAVVTVSGGKLVIKDLGSSNGTYLEEKKISEGTEGVISPGMRVVVGSFVLVFDYENQAAATGAFAQVDSNKEASSSPTTGSVRSLKKALFEEEIKLKHTIREELIKRLDLRRKDIIALSESELRGKAKAVVEQILVDLRWAIPDGLDRELLIKQVLDEALGLGPLEELLARDDCSEIMVNSFDKIYAEFGGKLILTDYRFSSEQSVLSAIERILAPIGRRVDEASPMVDARLKDGSRVNAVIRPLALAGPCITIRKFRKDPLVIDDLVRFGSMSRGMASFLKLAVENRMNIVISGGTGSGKTTLLNVISGFIPDEQRVLTVEDAAELSLPQEHVVSFETKPPNLEGKGAITIRDLVRNALRMRPDRIIVGECRGAEALDMLQAMNTGHDGSMTTGHSNSPADMIRRLETMVLTAGLDLPMRAVREQIASAVHIVLQQTRFSCGTRKVTAISEVTGIDSDEGTVMLEDIFLFRQQGYGADGRIHGFHQATGYIPRFFRKMQERGLPVDASVFTPEG